MDIVLVILFFVYSTNIFSQRKKNIPINEGIRASEVMLIDQNGEVLITNDGATVLDTAKVEHPTAKLPEHWRARSR